MKYRYKTCILKGGLQKFVPSQYPIINNDEFYTLMTYDVVLF